MTDSATRQSPPRPGRAAAVGPRLLIRQGKRKALLISQLTPISRGRSTIRHLWTRVVAVTALPRSTINTKTGYDDDETW